MNQLKKRERAKYRKQLQRAKLDACCKDKIKVYDRHRIAKRRKQIEKRKIHRCQVNAARQERFRLRQKIPSDTEQYEELMNTFLEAGLNSPSKKEFLMAAIGKCVQKYTNENTKQPLIHLRQLKSQNRCDEHEKLVKELLDLHSSYRNAAQALGVHTTTFFNLCKSPEREKLTERKSQYLQRKTEIADFYKQQDISFNVPTARHCNRRFLLNTLEETYAIYTKKCKEMDKKPMSFSAFNEMRPKFIYTIGQTPNRACVCEVCENGRLVAAAAHNFIRGIPSSTIKSGVKLSLCDVLPTDEADVTFGKYECVMRSCTECGTKKIFDEILKADEDIKCSMEADGTIPEYIKWLVGQREKENMKPKHRGKKATSNKSEVGHDVKEVKWARWKNVDKEVANKKEKLQMKYDNDNDGGKKK